MDRNASAILSPCTISHICIAAGKPMFSPIVKHVLALAINKAISKEALENLSFKWVCLSKKTVRRFCFDVFLSKTSDVLLWYSGYIKIKYLLNFPGLMQSFESVFKHMTHIGRSSLFKLDAMKPNFIYSELYLGFFLLFISKN